jgi:hypothetical protein
LPGSSIGVIWVRHDVNRTSLISVFSFASLTLK